MDTGTVSIHTGSDAHGGASPAPTGDLRNRSSRPESAKSVTEFIGLTARASKLHKDGEEFCTNLLAEMKKYKIDPTMDKIQGDNYEARVISYSGWSVIMIFHETFVKREMAHVPSAVATRDVIRRLELSGDTNKVANVIVIFKEQYDKAEQVAAGLVNTFCAATGMFKDMTIQDWNASGELHVSMNMKDAVQLAETTSASPLPHADLAITVYAKTRDKERVGYGADADVKIEPIGSAFAIVDFKRVAADAFNSDFKIDPTVVITGLASPIKTNEMAMFLISAAADCFIRRNLWLSAYNSFGPGEKNLGNLFELNGKPFSCKNVQERGALIQAKFTSPVPLLAIDLQEGSDQFPGLKDLLANPDAIKDKLRTFSGGDSATMYDIIQAETLQYDGIVDTAQGRLDTRAIDFLFLVDPKGANVGHDRAAAFLDYPDPNDPRAVEKKASLLEEFYSPAKIDLSYITHRVFFNPDWVTAMTNDLIPSINLIVDSYVNNNAYDLSGLKRFAPNVGGGMFTPGGGSVGWQGWRRFQF